MARKPRTIHVAKITSTVKGVTYTNYYLRRTFRHDGKIKHETLGNLSDLPVPLIEMISRAPGVSYASTTAACSPMALSKRSCRRFVASA